MEDSLDAFREKLAGYGDEELLGILQSLDRERFPERYQAARDEARKRKAAGGLAAAAPDPALRYKTVWRRIGAGFLDAGMFLAVLMIGGWVTGYGVVDVEKAPPLVLACMTLPLPLYQVLMHWKYGATLGKLAFGVRVVDVATEGPIRLGQAVLRDIVPIVAALLPLPGGYLGEPVYRGLRTAADSADSLWALAEILTALFSAKRRAVHDFLADTVCIRV